MPSSSTNHSGVAALAPHLYLWTLVSSDHHVLLHHFLRHYSSLGVLLATHAHIVIHRRDNGTESDHGVRRVHAVLADFGGVGNVSEYVEPNVKELEGGKLARVNAVLRSLPPQAWLIYADTDELFSYPCDIASRLGRTGAACAHMSDRVDANIVGMRPIRRTPSIEEQFPTCTKTRGLVLKATTLKLTLLRARIHGHVPMYRTAHRVLAGPHVVGGYGGSGCTYLGRFSHYSMSAESYQLSTTKTHDGEYAEVYRRIAGLLDWKASTRDGGRLVFTAEARARINRTRMACPLQPQCVLRR